MIYIKNFKNYQEFDEVFALRECDNGHKSRKNKILLGCLKDRDFFRLCAHNSAYGKYLAVNNMADFKKMLLHDVSESSRGEDGYSCGFTIDGSYYIFHVANMEVDNLGLCEDGDARSIRYYSHERQRYFKMKAGKFFTRIIEECEFGKRLPQQAKSWLGEEFLTSWTAYAEPRVCGAFEFHYGDAESDFRTIYSSDNARGNFHSCMMDGLRYTMYFYSCKCHAAWLTDFDGRMFARCVVFDEVYDSTTGETLRLAERQYGDGAQDKFKKMLVDALVSRKLIDGYKQIGADCHDNRAFVLNDGTSISDHKLRIACELDGGDTVSYMDSFVYYDRYSHMAYNYDANYTDKLDSTDGELENDHENDCWSEYYEEYIPEDEAYYAENRDDYFYGDEIVTDIHGNYQFVDDCERCAECGEYVLRDNMVQEDGLPDDLFFCDADCVVGWASSHGYVWSDYDERYYLEEDAVIVNVRICLCQYGRGNAGYWEPAVIDRFTFEDNKDEMHKFDGEWYWLDGDLAKEAYKNMTLPALVVA